MIVASRVIPIFLEAQASVTLAVSIVTVRKINLKILTTTGTTHQMKQMILSLTVPCPAEGQALSKKGETTS